MKYNEFQSVAIHPNTFLNHVAFFLRKEKFMPEIFFVKQNRKIVVEAGANLRESAICEYLSIYPHIFKILNCRGNSLCGTCAVEIVSGRVDPPNDREKKKLGGKLKKKPNIRLACQLTVNGNIEVRTHI